MEEWCTPQMEEEIDYAMYRQEGLNIPMWEQDFAYRLVKLNQINASMWNTKFIQKVNQMIKDTDDAEKALLSKKTSTFAHQKTTYPTPKQSSMKNELTSKGTTVGKQDRVGKTHKKVKVNVDLKEADTKV